MGKTPLEASNCLEEQDEAPIYNLANIKIDEDFCVQKAHLG